ncbi:MAG: DUF3943 domain-containing protein [Candidatus Aminicenantes bacterium]|nr:DUF3943 domain-containing protein [Candidatus Aminicenantes bacterium]
MIIASALSSAIVLCLSLSNLRPLPESPARPKPLTAAAEVAASNIFVWTLNHYLSDESYSYISWETVRDNLRDSFEFDQTAYFANFYNHPYHGSVYFSCGRANGLNYWGSALCAFGGSLMWETMMESMRPSINDLVTTTLGGCVIGETTFRLSAQVRRANARGFGRIWREAAAFVLNPVGALNRLFDGRKDTDAPGGPGSGLVPQVPLWGEVYLASGMLAHSPELESDRAVPLFGFSLEYGDPAGSGWGGKPFDVFYARGRLRWGPERPHLSISLGGALIGKPLAGSGGSSHFLSINQNYEYYGFDTLRLGGSSFLGSLTSGFELSPRTRLTTAARLGVMALGGAEDISREPDGERRTYNYGTGLTAWAEADLDHGGFRYVSLSWRHFGLFTMKGQSTREAWDVAWGNIKAPLYRGLGCGVQVEYCRRHIDFENLAPSTRQVYEIRAFLTCQF